MLPCPNGGGTEGMPSLLCRFDSVWSLFDGLACLLFSFLELSDKYTLSPYSITVLLTQPQSLYLSVYISPSLFLQLTGKQAYAATRWASSSVASLWKPSPAKEVIIPSASPEVCSIIRNRSPMVHSIRIRSPEVHSVRNGSPEVRFFKNQSPQVQSFRHRSPELRSI